MISAFLIVKDEEELLEYCLQSFASLGDLLDVLSIVDNNSTDATLDIIDSWRTRMPIALTRHHADSHHGNMRDLALRQCRSPWIFYLDSDETVSTGLADYIRSGDMERWDSIDIYKYTTILDRYHYVEGGNGPSTRLFRNAPGVRFGQEIHTEPRADGRWHKQMIPPAQVIMFDHTACKSQEALWAKGHRYGWANRLGIVGVGPANEYVFRVEDAMRQHDRLIREFDPGIRARIFTGP